MIHTYITIDQVSITTIFQLALNGWVIMYEDHIRSPTLIDWGAYIYPSPYEIPCELSDTSVSSKSEKNYCWIICIWWLTIYSTGWGSNVISIFWIFIVCNLDHEAGYSWVLYSSILIVITTACITYKRAFYLCCISHIAV